MLEWSRANSTPDHPSSDCARLILDLIKEGCPTDQAFLSTYLYDCLERGFPATIVKTSRPQQTNPPCQNECNSENKQEKETNSRFESGIAWEEDVVNCFNEAVEISSMEPFQSTETCEATKLVLWIYDLTNDEAALQNLHSLYPQLNGKKNKKKSLFFFVLIIHIITNVSSQSKWKFLSSSQIRASVNYCHSQELICESFE